MNYVLNHPVGPYLAAVFCHKRNLGVCTLYIYCIPGNIVDAVFLLSFLPLFFPCHIFFLLLFSLPLTGTAAWLSGPPKEGGRRKRCWLGTDCCACLERGEAGAREGTDGPPDNSCW